MIEEVQFEQKLLKIRNRYFFAKVWGNDKNSAVLLIQGSGAQLLLWPEMFCKKLVCQGYFVISYDHRDTGRSSYVNFKETPYSLKDLAQDAISILHALNINKAHILGSSMGGYIAQLIGIYHAEYVRSLSLLMSSKVSMSMEHAFLKESENPFELPLPSKHFKEALEQLAILNRAEKNKTSYFIKLWQAYNGNAVPFSLLTWEKKAAEWINRSKNINNSYNHILAMKMSELDRTSLLKMIDLPTLILHGDQDPFFSLKHAYDLHDALYKSELSLIKGMGHLFHESFIDNVLEFFVSHIKRY
jgi:10-carbomethoxy-13-deoxycarminomycin esterase/esterase